MSHPLYVAFVWHQHQPLYKTHLDGRYHLPWVRLHGTKDYLDLVLLLARYPKLHQTVNLVPSLILQLEDYVSGQAVDPYLALMLSPTECLNAAQKQFIIDRFFDAHPTHLIAPHPRYRQLYEQRREYGASWCLEHWQLSDYGDLLVWHNLAWIDPLFWDDPEIARWLEQGQDFSFSDRKQLYRKQQEILGRIIPQHRQMQNAGQLEVTTSPYTHPILPLLADTDLGRVAVPEMVLPKQRFQWPADIHRHLQKAWDLYQDRFGQSPRGLWPSEQAVSPQILPAVAQQGFHWLCSDEAVLGWSLDRFFQRDRAGTVLDPERLYRPYRVETDRGELSIVFRDRSLSDAIGFTYGAMEPRQAAADLVERLERIADSLKQRQESEQTDLEHPWLVTIALDGENCWEFYPQDGKPFLEALYGTFCDRTDLQLVTVSEFLNRFPATQTLSPQQLHSGSWVDGSLTTWIGDPAKNRAWDLLADARQTLAQHPEATIDQNPDAWEALYAAEGSDWFWWFGEGHSSHQDALFDRLFRDHLISLYRALNEPVPPNLLEPVERHSSENHHPPTGFIHPKVDGNGDRKEWALAGRMEIGGARGTMHSSNPIQRLYYGINRSNFYIRLDFQTGMQPGTDYPPEVNLFWFHPNQARHSSPIPLEQLPDRAPLNYRFHYHLAINAIAQSIRCQTAIDRNGWQSQPSRSQIGIYKSLEIAIPWADLEIESDWPLQLIIVLAEKNRFCNQLPDKGLIAIEIP